MTMTVEWINPEDCTEENGKVASAYSKVNLARLKENKAQNDIDGKQTRGLGHWRNDEDVIENLNYAAMTNKPENLWIGVGYDEFAMGYHSLESAQELASQPNWQSPEE
jgi:hypothetical protein